MSKAVLGAVEIGAAIAAAAAASVFAPALMVNPVFLHTLFAIGLQGAAMEAGAIAEALTANRGQNITTRQPASYRQVIYGEQRVGGTIIYQSTTGSKHDQYNLIVVFAGHEIDSFVNLYFDGRQVYWQGSGGGYSVRNGVGFGGIADSNDHVGPDGVKYNFGGTGHSGIYVEARYGDQLDGDVIGGLTANDPTWAAGTNGSPSVMGCAYLYIKLEYNTSVFPQMPPEIRATIRGKNNVLDPRTGQRGYTNNWALIVADALSNPDGIDQVGLADDTVNQAQLIAAANVCDEQVALAAGGTEARYTANYHTDTSSAPGTVLDALMMGAAGRLSRIGGEWYIWPAYWQGPTFSFDESSITAPIRWTPKRKYRDLFNRVNGTYVAPNYPYNVAGNLYDANGWANGQIQNNFPFAFQATNFPQVACDPLHGYAADQYLLEDGGRLLTKELGLQCVLSVGQAQRVAKINLLRSRHQGSGTFEMALSAWQMQPIDVMTFTFASRGWVGKTLEVASVNFTVGNEDEGPSIRASFGVQETSESVYEWSTQEELTVYDVPAAPLRAPIVPSPPSNLVLNPLTSVQPDGALVHQLQVSWDTPQDTRVVQIQVQYQPTSNTSMWIDGETVSVLSNATLLTLISGQTYNVRICSLWANGAMSPWIMGTEGVPIAYSPAVVQGSGIAGSSLTLDGTAAQISSFTATYGSQPLSYYPNDATVAGLTKADTTYYIYTQDPTYSGGSPQPVATTNPSDYLNKVGYVLLGTVRTPSSNTTTSTA